MHACWYTAANVVPDPTTDQRVGTVDGLDAHAMLNYTCMDIIVQYPPSLQHTLQPLSPLGFCSSSCCRTSSHDAGLISTSILLAHAMPACLPVCSNDVCMRCDGCCGDMRVSLCCRHAPHEAVSVWCHRTHTRCRECAVAPTYPHGAGHWRLLPHHCGKTCLHIDHHAYPCHVFNEKNRMSMLICICVCLACFLRDWQVCALP